jgi:Tfp pilus assembly protein PilN
MLEQYYRISEAIGVSIAIDASGHTAINACSVTIANNQLSFGKKITDLSAVEELAKHFPAKSIVAFNLSGKGILLKQLEGTEEINQNNFNKILPNASIEDFYVQNFLSGSRSFVSVIRKVEADRWINQLKELGFVPLMLSLGPFPTQNIIAQLNVYGNELIFNGHTIQRNEQMEWIAYHYKETGFSPFPFKVESENLSEKLIISYATAFQLVLADKVEPVKAEVPLLETALRKLIEEKKLKVQGFLVLSVFFMLLLINFFLFSWLNSSNAKLTEQVSRSAQSTEDIQKVNEQVQQKEGLLKTLGWEGDLNKSALIDQAASLLPGDITWKEVAIDPIDLSGSRSQKSIVFLNRKIRIVGNSEKIIPVNEWIARIKTKEWVKNVQLDSYTYNNELNTGQFIVVIDY